MKLFDVLDGFIENIGDIEQDRAEIEARLSDLDEVEAYAEAAGRAISAAEAARIRDAGLAWVRDVNEGNGEWGRMRDEAKAALSGD